MNKKVIYWVAAALVIAALGFAGTNLLKPNSPVEFQKGFCYVAWTKNGYQNTNSVESMEQMAALGTNWTCLVTTWFQDRIDSTDIHPSRSKTPSDESLRFAIRKMGELNIKVTLKPHLDIIQSEGRWRGEIGFTNPADWQAWFASYADFVLHYARLAQEEDVQMLCIGTELTTATLSHPELWRELIKKIRGVYSGKLTYAANWSDEFSDIAFWDQLDYAGIDSYFPLVASDNPTEEQLKSVWQDWLKMIEPWQKRINKPVIFTEIVYKSAVGSADEPWAHSPAGSVDLELQSNCYQALLATFYDKPWFYGLYWWYWGANPEMGGKFHRGFTPQNKPAQEVVKEWYQKPVGKKIY